MKKTAPNTQISQEDVININDIPQLITNYCTTDNDQVKDYDFDDMNIDVLSFDNTIKIPYVIPPMITNTESSTNKRLKNKSYILTNYCIKQKYMQDHPYRSCGIFIIILLILTLSLSLISLLGFKKATDISNQFIIIQNHPPACPNFNNQCIEEIGTQTLQYANGLVIHANINIISFILFLIGFMIYSPPCGMKNYDQWRNKEATKGACCISIFIVKIGMLICNLCICAFSLVLIFYISRNEKSSTSCMQYMYKIQNDSCFNSKYNLQNLVEYWFYFGKIPYILSIITMVTSFFLIPFVWIFIEDDFLTCCCIICSETNIF